MNIIFNISFHTFNKNKIFNMNFKHHLRPIINDVHPVSGLSFVRRIRFQIKYRVTVGIGPGGINYFRVNIQLKTSVVWRLFCFQFTVGIL